MGNYLLGSCGVDEDEVPAHKASENEVEMDCFSSEAREQDRKDDGGEEDSGEEGRAVAVVEVVAGFKVPVVGGVDVEEPRVHQAIGGV
jgi:hypothetical protein